MPSRIMQTSSTGAPTVEPPYNHALLFLDDILLHRTEHA